MNSRFPAEESSAFSVNYCSSFNIDIHQVPKRLVHDACVVSLNPASNIILEEEDEKGPVEHSCSQLL